MQVLHRGRTEDDEKPHPEGCPLEGDHFIGFAFFGLIVGFENHRVEKEGQQAENQEELDKKDREIFGMVLDAGTRL